MIKEPTLQCHNCDSSQILIFSRYVKVTESLYARVIIWVNTILTHIDTRMLLPKYEGSCMAYRPKWYQNKNAITYPYPTGIKNYEILIIETRTVSK